MYKDYAARSPMNLRLQTSRLVRKVEDLTRVDIVPRRYWSPIAYDPPPQFWDRATPLIAVDWDLGHQAQLYQRITPLMNGATAGGMLGLEDARVLRGVIRHLRPARVIELGSGHSTRLIRAATSGEHFVYDPYPSKGVRSTGDIVVERKSVMALPVSEFAILDANDVLFVDTSHVVKLGGDVNRIILEILPTLRAGVWVHFHDIFLPWEYPRYVVDKRLCWAEQYLLHAFLAFNTHFRVELAIHALARTGRIEPRQAVPGSFWIQRIGGIPEVGLV